MARMWSSRSCVRNIGTFVAIVVWVITFSVLNAAGSLISSPEPKCPLSFASAVEYCFVECIKEKCLPVGIQFQVEEDGSSCICMCPLPPEEENPRIEVRRPDFPVGG